MTQWHFYDPSSGVIQPVTFVGPEHLVEANTPAGLIAVHGVTDRERQRVDLKTGQLVVCMPEAPASTEWITWEWDAGVSQWRAVKTEAGIAKDLRAERDRRLAACDWIVTRSSERGEPVPSEWQRYRQALRDISGQPGWPCSVDWPEVPCN